MPRICLLIILLLSSSSLSALESYLDMEGFVYSGPVPYSEFTGEWASGFQEKNSVIGYTWLEAGVHNQQWGLSIVQQQYVQMQFSGDMAEFHYLTQNRRPLEADRRYEMDYQINAYTTEGVRLFHRLQPHQNISLQLGAHLMKGSDFQSGRISGSVTALSDRDYDYDNLQIDYRYSEDRVFNSVVESIKGEGIALDLSAHWEINRNNQLSLQVRNLAGYIKWKNSPYSTGTLASDDKSYDENGYVTVNQALNGNTETATYRQQLSILWQAELEHHYSSRNRLHAQIVGSEVQNFYRIGISHRIFGKQNLTLLYTLNTQAFGFAYENDAFKLQVQLDSLKPSQSYTLGLLIQTGIEL
ncbi:MAG: hypothetical protein L3J62_01510 [Gammaproteobacteria bacterium]|nr:hypothetical protein [Gammaproteobacteria bacterium]MCF6229463.1 hypothetical protein [Gammaproteobacteria bacterium]